MLGSTVDSQAEVGSAPGAGFNRLAAAIVLVILSAVWTWWALNAGAYFGAVLLPGGLLLCATLAIVIGVSPGRLRITAPIAVALAALAALAAWAALSAIWSPAPEIAIGDGQRIAIYAIAFALGAWLCALLGRSIHFSLAPLAIAAGVAGTAAAVALLTSDLPRGVLEQDGTLDYPLGYRNANAAFFGISTFAAAGLAATRGLDWRLRGLAFAVTTLCLDLVVLCQSRASLGALPIAVLAYVLISPERLRALLWLALAALPVVAVLSPATELYSAADNSLAGVVDEMRTAGAVVLLTASAAVVMGLFAARFEHRLPGLRSDSRSNRWVALGVAVSLAAAAAAFVVEVGDPVEWGEERIEEFKAGYSDELSGPVGRFTVDIGSGRNDIWRVALETFREHPLLGEGGGGFEYSWVRNRNIPQEARDAHSIELEILSELGLPGFLMFIVALGAAAIAITRARRTSTASAALGAATVAAGTYWLVHSSVDWFWSYPAVTTPVMALLGAACVPALDRAVRCGFRALRLVTISALALLAITLVPPFVSERYLRSAYAVWRVDLERAYDDLDAARTLNPFSITPLLAEAVIATDSGDPARALSALRRASSQQPEDWATHFLLAQMLQQREPQEARREILTALELNPDGDRIRPLARRLGVRLAPAAD